MFYSNKILIVFFFHVIATIQSYAQSFDSKQLAEQKRAMEEFVSIKKTKIDSLKKHLINAADTTRVYLLNDLYSNTLALDNTLASGYLKEALVISQQTIFAKGEAITYVNMAKLEMEEKNLPLSEIYFKKAFVILREHGMDDKYYNALHEYGISLGMQLRYHEATKVNDEVYRYQQQHTEDPLIAYAHRRYGILLDAQGHYEAAFDHFLKDMAISKKMKDVKGDRKSYIIFVNYYLGKLFEDAGDKKTAILYYRESAERALDNLMPDVYDEKMASIHTLQGNYDSALYYHRLREYCVSIFVKDRRFFTIIMDVLRIPLADLFLKQRLFNDAIRLYEKALPYCRTYQAIAPQVYKGLSIAYRLTGNPQLSLRYANMLNDVAVKSGSRVLLRDAAETNWKIYDTLDQKDSAYKYLKIYMNLRDTLSADKQLRNIALLEMKNRDDQQVAQIAGFAKERIIHSKERQILLIILSGVVLAALLIVWNISLKRKHAVTMFEKRTAQLEMQALRAQMNPHFIFNTLNSINSFILKNERKEASRYLTKFSKLIRMILINSQSQMIALTDELEALRLYIELEQVRFDNRFTYIINVPPELNISIIKVPPLVIQPYVENAIWHGLLHKDGPGHLEVEFFSKNHMLYCKVSDDGIGRAKVKELKSEGITTYKSVGMVITRERIITLAYPDGEEEPVRVIDVVAENGSPLGTKVIIKLPFGHDQDDNS